MTVAPRRRYDVMVVGSRTSSVVCTRIMYGIIILSALKLFVEMGRDTHKHATHICINGTALHSILREFVENINIIQMPTLMRNSLTPSASGNTFCRLVQELFEEILTDIMSKFYYLRRLTYLLVLRVEVYQGESTASALLTQRVFITRAFIFGTRTGVLNSIAATGAVGETTYIIKFSQCDFSRALYLNTLNVGLKLVGTS